MRATHHSKDTTFAEHSSCVGVINRRTSAPAAVHSVGTMNARVLYFFFFPRRFFFSISIRYSLVPRARTRSAAAAAIPLKASKTAILLLLPCRRTRAFPPDPQLPVTPFK